MKGAATVVYNKHNLTLTVSDAIINGNNCDVIGNRNVINGSNCDVVGDDNTVNGANANVVGNRNKINGRNSDVVSGGGGGGGMIFNNFSGVKIGGRTGIVQQNVGANGSVTTVTFGSGGMVTITTKNVSSGRSSQINIGTVGEGGGGKKKKREKEEDRDEIQFVEGPTNSELVHDKELNDNESGGCVVCLTNAANCIVWPCRHACVCVKCARMLCFFHVNDDPTEPETLREIGKVSCPTCRGKAEKILRIHS
jgi:hypothetical protein